MMLSLKSELSDSLALLTAADLIKRHACCGTYNVKQHNTSAHLTNDGPPKNVILQVIIGLAYKSRYPLHNTA